MPSMPLPSHRVVAYNTAGNSENKIHDDAVARRFGFGGGLVPGVDVYAYMTHLPVAHWGRAWLERGTAECRFLKPVHDGDLVTVSAVEDGDGLAITLEARGITCATGRASLPDAASPPALADWNKVAERMPLPPADATSLAVGTRLGVAPIDYTPKLAAEYLNNERETLPIYAAEGLVHPVAVPRLGNFALNRNVTLGPWMHVGSKIRHFAAARVGDALSARARVTGNYEHKGHLFVDLDVLILANDRTAIARADHISIYRPRQVLAA
jgi:acyl dehydratase